MCAWCPTAQAYEEMHPLEFMHTHWSSGTLETPADMERLFSLLEQFRGGDGLPALFEPLYIVGNPDFAAIAANGFSQYVDVALDQGVPAGWQRGDLAAKARGGMDRGVWHPAYHCRAHHFSPASWVERLRQGDEWARFAFERHIYVCELVKDRLPEYTGMSEAEQAAWLREGLAIFDRAFGFQADSTCNGELTETAIKVFADSGVQVITDKVAVARPDERLVYLERPISFEPAATADREDIVARTVAQIEQEWAAGRPPMIVSHRRNYKALDQGNVERSFACLERVLGAVASRHPEAMYLSASEIAQLARQSYSIVRRGRRIICRNYSQQPLPVSLAIGGVDHSLTLPRGETMIRVSASD